MPSNVRVRNVAFFRVLRSEWLKFRTLGSTWWILVIALLLTVGVGELVAWSIREILNGGIAEVPPEAMVGLNSTEPSVGTLQLSQLVLTILGVLFITNEFSSGSIRSTVIAAPTRSVVIIAKAVILTFVTFIVSFVALFGTEELSWYTFTSEFVEDVRTVPEGLKIIAGASLANTLIVLFAFGIGVLLHNTAGSIGLVLGTLLVVPIVMQMLPWDWAATAAHYLPSACTTWLYTFPAAAQQAADNPFTFLEALGVSCAWAFVPLLLGLITFKVRDANASGA
jgi:ABC-2 type transport system permease protein